MYWVIFFYLACSHKAVRSTLHTGQGGLNDPTANKRTYLLTYLACWNCCQCRSFLMCHGVFNKEIVCKCQVKSTSEMEVHLLTSVLLWLGYPGCVSVYEDLQLE